jgi:hypothetical protein
MSLARLQARGEEPSIMNEETASPTQVLVFQQKGSGENKIKGIREFGGGDFEVQTCDIEAQLPKIIDDTSLYLPKAIAADIVLDYLKHPDLSEDLAALCAGQGVPLVASGKRPGRVKGPVFSPPVCCALLNRPQLGPYARRFGFPVYRVQLKEGIIEDLQVLRGAPCGATWKALQRVRGLPPEEAQIAIGLETQFFCTANPAGWDPLVSSSPVHLAGRIHACALKVALKRAAART